MGVKFCSKALKSSVESFQKGAINGCALPALKGMVNKKSKNNKKIIKWNKKEKNDNLKKLKI